MNNRTRVLYVVATKATAKKRAQMFPLPDHVPIFTNQHDLQRRMAQEGLNRRDYRVVRFRIVGEW